MHNLQGTSLPPFAIYPSDQNLFVVLIPSILLSLLLLGALVAPFSMHAYAAGVTAELGKPFNLKINQNASIEPAGIEVTFANVTEDSRCPSDVTCIWAGQVSVVFDVKVAGNNSSELVLTLTGGQPDAKSFGNYSIKLTDVQPYPISTKKISLEDYTTTLVVESSDRDNSHGVFVKAIAPDGAAIAGWNVERGNGAIVLLLKDGTFKRTIIKFTPTISQNCSHGPESSECIEGIVLSSKGNIALEEGTVHIEVNNSKMHAFLTLPGYGSERVFNITKLREWSRPIENAGNQISLKEGQRDGPLLVQKIYADRVEGLNFPEYPVATDNGLPIILHMGEKASNGCTVTLTLVKVENGVATFAKEVNENKPCPICWLQQAFIS